MHVASAPETLNTWRNIRDLFERKNDIKVIADCGIKTISIAMNSPFSQVSDQSCDFTDLHSPCRSYSSGNLERVLADPPCTKCGATSIPYIPCLPKSIVDHELAALRMETSALRIAVQHQEMTINRITVVICGLLASMFILRIYN